MINVFLLALVKYELKYIKPSIKPFHNINVYAHR